ncbi:MAG: IS630 family transposase, partial [Planctomycetaceae bacterium]|nr:IS630 family transposase [Planctomycetaceae bacterium]
MIRYVVIFACYNEGGIDGLLENHYKGRPSYLTDEQKEKLKEHLRQNIYLDVKSIVEYVNAAFNVKYSIPGMTKLLHELNFVYKKPNIHPSGADSEAQRKWVRNYRKLRRNAGKNDVFYFVDGVHPQHNSMPSYGWIEKGTDAVILTNSGRQRININGALDIDTHTVEVVISPSVNSESVKRLMDKLIENNPEAKTIYMILDNARYYHSKEVEEYRKKLGKIIFVFLPPYSPNLNIVERIWKFFKKKILYN